MLKNLDIALADVANPANGIRCLILTAPVAAFAGANIGGMDNDDDEGDSKAGAGHNSLPDAGAGLGRFTIRCCASFATCPARSFRRSMAHAPASA